MPIPDHGRITFAIRGPIAQGDLPGLCARICALLHATGGGVVIVEVCDVRADAVTVDALARLQLVARRNSCEIRLRGASVALRELIAFMGLQDVLAQ